MLDNPIVTKAAALTAEWGSGTWGPNNWGMGNWGMGNWGMGNWGGHGFMWLGPIFWLIILALVIWFIVSRFSRGSNRGAHATAGGSPLDILKERYARGEIDTAEYEERRKLLK